MSELVKTSNRKLKNKYSSRIIIKNGIRYIVAITANKKHKYKKMKQFKTHKWIITNVLYLGRQVVNKPEIEKIIQDKKSEQGAYDKLFLQSIDEIYEIHLTDKQYQSFRKFTTLNELKLGDKFAFQRTGAGLKTKIEFIAVKSTKTVKA